MSTSTSSTRVQRPQNIPVRRTKQMVRLWLIFVIVALISEAISYIVNYPTTHYTRIDPVWAAIIIFGMDATCFAAGMLWLGRGRRPISRIIYGSAAFLMGAFAFQAGHGFIPTSITIALSFLIATLATIPRFHVRRHYKQVEIAISILIIVGALGLAWAFRIVSMYHPPLQIH